MLRNAKERDKGDIQTREVMRKKSAIGHTRGCSKAGDLIMKSYRAVLTIEQHHASVTQDFSVTLQVPVLRMYMTYKPYLQTQWESSAPSQVALSLNESMLTSIWDK